jgi:carboxymethylenebutenolidase
MAYTGMTTETVRYAGHNGDELEAYFAQPAGPGPFPGVVVIHHLPGWDEWTTEVVRKLAHHGYAAVSPHLYSRTGLAPDEAGAAAFRGLQAGGPVVGQPDAQAMADIDASVQWLKAQGSSNGRVGCIGFCSGGRLAYLAACSVPSLDAAVDCWGGAVTASARWPTNDAHPVAPIDLTPQMTVPLLGIFGNDDQFPTPQEVDQIEQALKNAGKEYEFERYDGAGHGFFATDRPSSRPEQAKDAWQKVFAFYAKHLNAPVAAAAVG